MTDPHLTIIHGPARTGKTIAARAIRKRLEAEGHTVASLCSADVAKSLMSSDRPLPGRVRPSHIILETNSPRLDRSLKVRASVIISTAVMR